MVTWIFARHGESHANLLHEFSNRGWKHGLTDVGFQQAHLLPDQLKPYPLAAIYTSPLQRACQTAEVVGQALGIVPQIADALIEFDTGSLEGKSDKHSWELYADITADWFERKNYSRRFEGGDSYTTILERFLPFFKGLQQRHAHSNQAVLMVGHGGTFRCVLPAILGNIDFGFISQHALSHTGIVVAREIDDKLLCQVWDSQIIIQA